MTDGYIRLYRKFLQWEWYSNVNVKTLFLHCLLKANYKDKNYQGILIKRGTFMTSLDRLHIETGLSVRQIRTALDKLISTNELTSETYTKYRIITVLKYNDYQMNDNQLDNQVTNKRQTSDKVATTTNKDNKEKKEEKRIYKEYVRLTEDEYSKLQKKLNGSLDKYLENLNNYIGSKGKKYKSHYHTILTWYNKDQKETPTIDTSFL